MRRRHLLGGLIALPAAARAQPAAKPRRLAIVSPSEPLAIMFEHGGNPYYRVLFESLRQLGYVEGKTMTVERHGREQAMAGPEPMMADVVRSNPDVIYAIGGAAVFLKKATATIPIVALTADPIAVGLVSNLARPGGNITGVAIDTGPSLHGKRIELLREAFPQMSKLAFVTSRRAWDSFQGPVMRAAADAAGVPLVAKLVGFPATEAEYRETILATPRDGADAVMIGDNPEALQFRATIVAAVAETRLPAIYTFAESVEAGGLLAYSFDLKELNRRAAQDIDSILRGTNAGEIPFYQVSRLILSINLKTAKALGIEFPPSILARADEVIE